MLSAGLARGHEPGVHVLGVVSAVLHLALGVRAGEPVVRHLGGVVPGVIGTGVADRGDVVRQAVSPGVILVEAVDDLV